MENKKRKDLKLVSGIVIQGKGDQRIKIVNYRFVKHPKYLKYIKRRSLFVAHDEKNEAKVGDTVKIFACRAFSKTKKYKLKEVVKGASK